MGITIRMARAKINASQDKMAQDLGVSRVTYRSWETGAAKIPGVYLQKLAEMTEINPADFILDEPTKKFSRETDPDEEGGA